MSTIRYLHLKGLDRPALFENAGPLEALIGEVLLSWPATWSTETPDRPPFATIRPGERRAWSICVEGGPRKDWDEVDTICDLVAELAWERLRARPELLCLHAAALEFTGRLVVFPDVKRAGKSTLCAALAHLGHTVFADDVLPVDLDGADGKIVGLSSGAAPRVRLPLPSSFSETFRDWVDADPGPRNDRYKYITDAKVAPDTAALPIGAIIILDRQDSPTPPSLKPLGRSDALAQVIRQNFSRDQHSGRILRAVEMLTKHLPLFRLTYSSGEEAAKFLHDHPELRALPSARNDKAHIADSLAWSARKKNAFEAEHPYRHATGLTEMQVEGEIFLADEGGAAIHRLNAGSVMIWRVLSEPAALEEVVAVLRSAFPEVDPAQIADDAQRTFSKLADAGLIVPDTTPRNADLEAS